MNLQRKDIAKNGTFPTVNVRIPVTLSSVEVQATITCLNFELLTSHWFRMFKLQSVAIIQKQKSDACKATVESFRLSAIYTT